MNLIQPYLPYLLGGAAVTAEVTLLGFAVAVFIGLVLALCRMARSRWLHWPAGAIVEVFRGTSSLVQLFWFFYALPFLGLQLTPIGAAVSVLALNEGAYASEVVRSAILAVPAGQREASIALNMSRWLRMRKVILPQAIPIMIPTFGNVLIDTLKTSSLVSLVTVADIAFRGEQIRTSVGHSSLLYGLLLVIYFIMSLILSGLRAVTERWVKRRYGITPARAARNWLRPWQRPEPPMAPTR